MKRMSFIQWFRSLLRRDMKEYEVDEMEKKNSYDKILKERKD